jgi:hypothetical protein
MDAPFRVLLPESIFLQAKSKEELIRLVLQYMQRYPHYAIKRIENRFAICERIETG